MPRSPFIFNYFHKYTLSGCTPRPRATPASLRLLSSRECVQFGRRGERCFMCLWDSVVKAGLGRNVFYIWPVSWCAAFPIFPVWCASQIHTPHMHMCILGSWVASFHCVFGVVVSHRWPVAKAGSGHYVYFAAAGTCPNCWPAEVELGRQQSSFDPSPPAQTCRLCHEVARFFFQHTCCIWQRITLPVHFALPES